MNLNGSNATLIAAAKAIAKAIIRHFEGCKLKAYICPSGKLTIAIGHVIVAGRDDWMKKGITAEQAEEIFEKDFAYFLDVVLKLVHVPLTAWQLGALIAWVFNCGKGNFENSTLLRVLNASNYAAVPHEMNRWTHGDKIDPKTGHKEVLPGLVRRRACESFVFNGGTIEKLNAAHWFQK